MAPCLAASLHHPLLPRWLSPSPPLLALCLAGWLALLQPGVTRASNLDTRFPLVKAGGSRGSLFGFSVALHEQSAGAGGARSRYLLLVGAPKEKAEPDVSANQTGGVYSCPITTDQSDCTRMNLIGSDADLDPTEDLVEDMWLGVTVASQRQPGGRVLACGHRFMKLFGTQELRHMIGKCYLHGNDLQYNASDTQWHPGQVCSHNSDSGQHMCNMGISAAITQNEILVGSPGSYEWQGNAHVSWMNPEDQYDTQRSSFRNLDRRHTYMGYSVAQASGLLSQDVVTIVTGAPKDNTEDGRGSVYLAERAGPLSARHLEPRVTLRGEQMGSYYGNSLAIADLNNDGWADLLVGAPFYFQRQREEGGSVYVYLNQNGRLGPGASTTLRGPHASGFGMALLAIGDLNQDGFQDFAVGAPFHGTGSVMIWTGSAEGISKDPSQVIQGRDISGGFRMFGYSLGGGLDVDQNHYPDLLVGSLDNRVALLRARPVIQLNKTMQVSPEIVDPDKCDDCVQVEVCFSYILSTGDESFRNNITVQFSLEADVTRHSSRLRFRDNGQDVYHGFLSMPSQRCRTLRLGLLKHIRDKVEPLVFSLNVSLYENPHQNHDSLQSLDQYPVLSQARPAPIRTQIHIQKACGSDNRCQSNLQLSAQFTSEQLVPFPSEQGMQLFHYNASIRKLLLVVEVTNYPSPRRPGEDAHSAALNITIPPSLKYSGVRSKSRSPVVECSAENQVLLCDLGNPFMSDQKAQVLIIFETSEISLDTREIQSTLQLSTLSEQSDLSPVSLLMMVQYSLETSFTQIKKPGHTQFSGHVTGESAMKTTSDIGSPLDFTFKVEVVGKPLGHLGQLEVEFDWPWEVSNGKWLLYMTEIRLVGTSESHCVPPGDIINPLNLTLSEEEERRRRRSLEEEPRGVQSVLNLQGARKKSYTLDCVHGAARCVKFICPLVNMNNTAMVTVRARLWNSTMLEDYSEAQRVTVTGLASLKLVTDKPTIKMKPQSTEFSVDVGREFSEQLDHGAPLWIIIVSALAGVLLLACICLLLWKCGFFRRASTRELYEAKAQTAHMKTQPSEVERLTEEH